MSELLRSSTIKQKLWGGIILLMLLAFIILLAAQVNRPTTSELKPYRPTPTRHDLLLDNQPILVTFDQLNADPENFLNQRIRVTGDFQLLTPPTCRLYNGPALRWSLIASDLQLDALGYEPIARLIPAGVSLTVEGAWRLYEGPLGCGKAPPTGRAWYLDVTRILQPNPLPLTDGSLFNGSIATPLALPTGAPGQQPVDSGSTPIPTSTNAITATPTPTMTPTDSGTAAATPSPTITTTPAPGTTLPTATVRTTSTPTATPTTTGTPGPSPTPAPTLPVLPTPTIDVGGYPGNGGGGPYP